MTDTNGTSDPERGAPAGAVHKRSGVIYKSGEGYWVRVMTAVMIGALFLSFGAWAYKSLEAVSIPVKAWELTLKSVSGQVTTGQDMELFGARTTGDGAASSIGTARVLEASAGVAGDAKVKIGDLRMIGTATPEDSKNYEVRVGAPGAQAVTATVGFAAPIPLFERLYLQAGVAGVLLLAGAILAYYVAGVHASTVDFLIATDNEMKKVNWSTRREILGSTYVVVSACFLIATALFIIDYCFSHFFMAIDVLRSR